MEAREKVDDFDLFEGWSNLWSRLNYSIGVKIFVLVCL